MKNRTFHGKASSFGIAIGKLWIHPRKNPNFVRRHIQENQIQAEQVRLQEAISSSQNQIQQAQDKLCRFQSKDHIEILEAYLHLLKDASFKNSVERHIKESLVNAERAVEISMNETSANLDLESLLGRILKNLVGVIHDPWKDLPQGEWIIKSEHLTPTEIITLPKEKVAGLIISTGGPTSHSLIIAKSLNLPTVVGISILEEQKEITCIVDASHQRVILSPSSEELKQYSDLGEKQIALEAILLKESHQPAISKDGIRIRIEANIELPTESTVALNHGAEGIGLFRTEFLSYGRVVHPSEEDQFEIYKEVLKKFKSSVTIRTFDFSEEDWPASSKTAFGLRGLRKSFSEPETLYTQLRALLRASTFGQLRILFPMVSGVEDIIKVKEIINQLCTDIGEIKPPSLGVMIETPSAALTTDLLSQEVDFFAIGTNDLIQYLLVADRSTEQSNKHYTPYHPSILRILERIIGDCKEKPLCVCGELASDPRYIPILLGAGIRCLSMNALSIPRAKKMIRELSIAQCQDLFKNLSTFSMPMEIESQISY